jgi:hypothetical protein
MSAFQAYAGAYEFGDEAFSWRCYATIRVHAVRRQEHAPFPPAPSGRKWLWLSPMHAEPAVGWLVDDSADEFSHILLQITPQAARSERLAEAV